MKEQKHIEIDCHVVREKVQAQILHFLPVTSKGRVTDILTKSLHAGPFNILRNKHEMFDLYSSLREDVQQENERIREVTYIPN